MGAKYPGRLNCFASVSYTHLCVYITSGKYKITKNITVPAGVTLCGDWKSPEETPAGSEGTVILAYVPAYYDRELFNMVSDAGPVSYTHLDVYKRKSMN